ncbi:MAG: PQQ-binding-like beta-propeller repeat protein [Chlorobi bacterium]|nr:PQQ-binding-like beta-propeller repeat protein [Chlorobiota bacterium]
MISGLKYIVFIFLIINFQDFAQSFSFHWLVNPLAGSQIFENETESFIDSINNRKENPFTVIAGNLTESGEDKELRNAKRLFDRLIKPYHIIPGTNEDITSLSRGSKFEDLWDERKFSFAHDDILFLGLDAGTDYASPLGFIRIEDFAWIKEELSEVDSAKKIILFLNQPERREIENFGKLVNILKSKNIQAIFVAGFGKKYLSAYSSVPVFHTTLKKINKPELLSIRVDSSSINILKDNNPLATIPFQNRSENIEPESVKKPDNIAANILLEKELSYTTTVSPVIANGQIITADRAGLVSSFAKNGKLLWEYDTFGNVVYDMTAADGFLAVATAQGDLNSIQIKTGDPLQTIGFDELISTHLIHFDYKGKRRLMIPKQTKSKAAVFFGTVSGKVFCLDMETFEEIWSRQISDSPVLSKPLYVNNKIYFFDGKGVIYNIDARDGVLIWKFKPDKNAVFSKDFILTGNDKSIFLADVKGNIFAIDAKLGKFRWRKISANAQSMKASTDAKNLFVKTNNNRFLFINPSNGKTIKTLNMNFGTDYSFVPPLNDGDLIFVASERGNIYRINKKRNYKTILSLGNSPIVSLRKIGNSTYCAENYNGRIVLFHFSE